LEKKGEKKVVKDEKSRERKFRKPMDLLAARKERIEMVKKL
jgi:hypothetical protein